MEKESAIKLFPLSPLPSLLHARIALPTLLSHSNSFINSTTELEPTSFLSLPSNHSFSTNSTKTKIPSIASNELREIRAPSNQDWWRWSTPTVSLALKAIAHPSASLNYEENFARTGEAGGGRLDGKMVGTWRVGAGIGSGMSGRVRIARSTVTGQFAAIKMIKKVQSTTSSAMAGDREIIILKLVEHPNVLRLLDVFETQDHTYLITEYCGGGELFAYVSENKLSYDLSHDLFCQLIDALSHLHKMGVAHRDIKLENILVVPDANGDLTLKLADLGMAAFQIPGDLLSTSCGSPHYASPEVITGRPYDGPTADIWSAGIILFALISKSLPFDDENIPQLLANIKRGRFIMRDCITGDVRDLISRMLVVRPSDRITMREIRVHPYLTEGGYEFTESNLPYPLVLDPPSHHFDPVSREEIDPVVIDNLLVLCPGELEADVIDSVVSKKDSKARVFYAILHNYRTRAYASETERALLLAAAADRPIRRIVPRQARRSISAPSLATSLNSSCIGFIECAVCHSSNRITKSHIHSEGILEESEMEEKENRPVPLIEIDNLEGSERGDDLLTMLEAGDIKFFPYSSSNSSIPIAPRNSSLENSINSQQSQSEYKKGISNRVKGFFSPTGGKNERTVPLFGNLLKRSTGYSSLRAVVLPDPIPSPSLPTSRFSTDRAPLSPIENFHSGSKRINSPISDFFTSSKNFLKNKKSIITPGSSLMYASTQSHHREESAFSDYDTSHSSNEITKMAFSLPPSPSPKDSTGRAMGKKIINRPSPLILADLRPLELNIKSSDTGFSTFSTDDFTWSPEDVINRRPSQAINSAFESTGTSAEIDGGFKFSKDLNEGRLGEFGENKRPTVIRKYSDILLDGLEQEVKELRRVNESLLLENGILRQAVDTEIVGLEAKMLEKAGSKAAVAANI